MKYKETLIDVLKTYLRSKGHSRKEVDQLLGGWNFAINTDSRNDFIEKTVNSLKNELTETKPNE